MKNVEPFVFKIEPLNLKAELESIYLEEESSFILYTQTTTSSLMLGHHYLSLEVECERRTAVGVSGYFNLKTCKTGYIEVKKSELGQSILIDSHEILESGVGYSCNISHKAVYDRNKDVLFLGDWNYKNRLIRINKNVSVGVYEGRVMCIQIVSVAKG